VSEFSHSRRSDFGNIMILGLRAKNGEYFWPRQAVAKFVRTQMPKRFPLSNTKGRPFNAAKVAL